MMNDASPIHRTGPGKILLSVAGLKTSETMKRI